MSRLGKPGFCICVVFLVALAGKALGEQNYLENSSFDTDVSGWTFLGDEGETLEWDGTLGFPSPGSLRLGAIDSTTVGPIALSECFVAPPGSSWNLEAFGRRELNSTELSCGLAFFIFEQPDCTIPIASAVVSGENFAGADWTPLNAAFEIPEGYNGIQAVLSMSVGLSASGACNFDSVRLTGPPNFAEVPALGPYTLAALIAALSLVGLFWLRRIH